MKRRSAVVAVGMVLVGAIAAGAASAATTSVKIVGDDRQRERGKVHGQGDLAEEGLHEGPQGHPLRGDRQPRRNYGYPGYEAVGKATTRSNGNWEVKASEAFLEGDYRAFVAAKRVTAGDETLLCMPAGDRQPLTARAARAGAEQSIGRDRRALRPRARRT